jgi:hypothetical protein
MQSTTRGHGLPDWTLKRLELIGEQRPGTIGSEAIKAIAEAGERERAMALLNVKDKPFVDPAAVALALPQDDLSQLAAILKDDSYTDTVRVGAFEQLVKRRDQSELVGDAFTYAFSSEREALRLVAFAEYSGWGRHHSRSIFISWSELLREAFDDDDQTMRYRVTSAFRFTPFDTRQQRDEFLLEMLHGTENQQLTALVSLSSLTLVPDSIKTRVSEMTKSAIPSVAEQAAVLHERYRPKERFEGLGSTIAGALLWALLVLPALTAVGFATYLIARLLQSVAAGWPVGLPLLISMAWLVLSIGLGMVLAMGVMGLHRGVDEELYVVLLVINVVFAGAGWLLSFVVRKFGHNQTGRQQRLRAG